MLYKYSTQKGVSQQCHIIVGSQINISVIKEPLILTVKNILRI